MFTHATYFGAVGDMGEVEEDVVHGGPVRVGDGQLQGRGGHLQRLLHLLGTDGGCR